MQEKFEETKRTIFTLVFHCSFVCVHFSLFISLVVYVKPWGWLDLLVFPYTILINLVYTPAVGQDLNSHAFKIQDHTVNRVSQHNSSC